MLNEAVSPVLVEILGTLMEMPEFERFALGGGTSLALRFGHRRSMDIDLFTAGPFDSERLFETVRSGWPEVALLNRTRGSLSLEIHTVKVDLLHHACPQLDESENQDGIRLLSIADVAAMKVNAITNRGSKKDFTDLLVLHMNGTSLKTSLEYFCRKYGAAAKFLAIRSLQFFNDAQSEPDPVFLNDWTWEFVEGAFAPIATGLS